MSSETIDFEVTLVPLSSQPSISPGHVQRSFLEKHKLLLHVHEWSALLKMFYLHDGF